MKHVHGKGIFDPNCKACRDVCRCEKPRPNRRNGYCRECLRDLPKRLMNKQPEKKAGRAKP